MFGKASLSVLVLFAFVGVTWSLPLDEFHYIPTELEHQEAEEYELVPIVHRYVRSLQPGAPSFPMPSGQQPWEINPAVSQGADGKTRGSVGVKHHGPNHDVHAGINVGGGRPRYNVGGTFRW